jgi:hypothetical protein
MAFISFDEIDQNIVVFQKIPFKPQMFSPSEQLYFYGDPIGFFFLLGLIW